MADAVVALFALLSGIDRQLTDACGTGAWQAERREAAYGGTVLHLEGRMSVEEPVLEAAAQAFADATAHLPFLRDVGLVEGRKAVDHVQDGDVPVVDAEVEDLVIPGGPSRRVSVRVFRPADAQGPLPVVLYVHGGWVFGNVRTHERLVRELTVRAQAAAVFVNYSLSPEAKYPTAIEEIYATLLWLSREGATRGFDPARTGGGRRLRRRPHGRSHRSTGQAAQGSRARGATAVLSRHRREFRHQFLRAVCEWLLPPPRGHEVVVDQYTTDRAERAQITASPLRANREELAGLPQELVIVAEADVLRDEGEAYAAKLRDSGVPTTAVCYQGTIHGFVVIDAIRDTYTARAATQQGGEFLYDVLHS
jgi:acetyl esterase